MKRILAFITWVQKCISSDFSTYLFIFDGFGKLLCTQKKWVGIFFCQCFSKWFITIVGVRRHVMIFFPWQKQITKRRIKTFLEYQSYSPFSMAKKCHIWSISNFKKRLQTNRIFFLSDLSTFLGDVKKLLHIFHYQHQKW